MSFNVIMKDKVLNEKARIVFQQVMKDKTQKEINRKVLHKHFHGYKSLFLEEQNSKVKNTQPFIWKNQLPRR